MRFTIALSVDLAPYTALPAFRHTPPWRPEQSGGVPPAARNEIWKGGRASATPAVIYLRPRLGFMLIFGQRAKMEVVKPPRGVNSPRTTHHSGRTAPTTSRRILLTAFS